MVESDKKASGADAKAPNGGKTHTVDMSLGGMSITMDQPLALGAILRVDFSLPDIQQPLSFFAEVVWAGPTSAGLQFIMVNSENEEKLKTFLDNVSTQ